MPRKSLEQVLTFLGSRFSEYHPQTIVTDQHFQAIEAAGKLKLNAGQRAAIQKHLQEYEFLRRLDQASYGEEFRSVLLKLEATLAKMLVIGRGLDSLPGHLWSYVTDRANISVEAETDRLKAILREVGELNTLIDKARSRRTSDPFLPRLLEALEKEFKAAGGGSVGISRGTSRTRGGPFVRFADEAVDAVFETWRPEKSIASRWDRILKARKQKRRPSRRESIWIGKPHPVLTKQ
jgi:hypothetical protein